MVDQEVADILEEIRSRVRAGSNPPETSAPTNSTVIELESGSEPVLPEPPPVTDSYSSLIVLARAWDRLPPLVTNRSGMSARLELWIKSKLKTALRWLTWEQINFNAATHRTFLELIESLTAYEQELHRVHHQLKKQLTASREEQQLEIDSQRAVLQTQRDELLKEIQNRRSQLVQQQAALDSLQLELNEQRSELKARLTEIGDQQVTQQSLLSTQIDELKTLHSKDVGDMQVQVAKTLDAQQSAAQSQLANLVREFRERDERLLDEQRVCVKQLSLELSESQVLQDRARREVESRITRLEEQENS